MGDLEDTDEEDLGLAPPVEVRWPLDIKKVEFSVFELHRRWTQKTLRLDPDFQREFVWRPDKQVKLVESVMARIPLPVFYLSDEPDQDELLVVDGQQRLTTLFAFMEGRFADPQVEGAVRRREEDVGGRPFVLRNLRMMKELEGKTFSTLEPKLRRRFEDTALVCFVIQSATAPDAKFELFERINEGTTPLVAQEIRNALYRGPGLSMIKRLAAPGSRFRALAGEHRTYSRMRADEFVLRGVSFLWHGWDQYGGDLKKFLNDCLRALNELDDAELISIERRFLHTLEFARLVFGSHAWQRFDSTRNEWGGHLSGPLVETVCAIGDRVFPSELPNQGQAHRIGTDFQMLCGDQQFVDSILSATQTVKNVRTRMTLFEEICRHAD